ncbi:MAG: sigma-54-dependent Fis family transcriptional regulator [Calditrichaeota bacterium]|nr:MAG: sigma-54-dependent Fis family transcriptional regulator [Calditrichota bacterium]
MLPIKIAVVDDEEIVRISLVDELQDAGYQVWGFSDPQAALDFIQNEKMDIVFSDIKMPDMNGIDLLKQIKAVQPDIIVIMITAHGSVDTAVKAMKEGAYDYLTKPFEMEEIFILLDRIREIQQIKSENKRLRSHFSSKYPLSAFVGESAVMKKIFDHVETIASSSTTVLITGETGTGKELLTNIIHNYSSRSKNPLIKVSCAILSREIFESELFGHEKGAFTGADKERLGRFETADGGTLYLDDVDDIPLDLQIKLLRVLQEQEFERVGGNNTIKVDVRVIASTKADLLQMVKDGKFREDLYYRLNIFPLHIQPLRKRKEDIPLLFDTYINQFSQGKTPVVQPEVVEYMKMYNWPGNVRELKNIVERLLLLSRGKTIDVSLLPVELLHCDDTARRKTNGNASLDQIMSEMEMNFIRQALQKSNGKQVKAAENLGIPVSTLRSKMEKYGLVGKIE